MDPKTASIDFFILAAEPSGDVHGAEIIRILRKKNPHLKIAGVAGPLMRKEKINTFMPMEKLTIMGFIEPLLHFPKLLFLFYKIRAFLLREKPKTCLFIDYPTFNLKLEKSLRKKGFKNKLIHYVCPSVWAYGKKRIQIMEKNLDHLFTLFPFEVQCFENTLLPVTYIGNPLVSKVRNYLSQNTFSQKNLISIFPGSRSREIDRNLPLQLKAVKKFMPKYPVALSLSDERYRKKIEKILKTESLSQKIPLIEPSFTYDLMKNTHLAIATSGTVTLELALHQIPTVVTFAVHIWDLFIVQKILKVDLPFYCIVNILKNEQVFPELFGPNLTLAKLCYYINVFLHSKKQRGLCLENLLDINKILKTKHPPEELLSQILFEKSGK